MSNLDKYIIWERPCYPGLVFIGAEAVVLPHIKHFGYPWSDTLCFFSNGMIRAVWDKEELMKNGVQIARNFLRPSYFQEKMDVYHKLSTNLFAWFESIDNTNFQSLNDEQLLNLNKKYNILFLDWWGFAQVAEPLAIGCEYLLNKNRVLSQEQISILTTPTKKSYTTVEEEELLKIVKEKILGNEVEKIFQISSDQEVMKHIEQSHLELWKKLQEHSQKYYWMLNSYTETRYLDASYFIGMIKEILAKELNKEDIDKIFLQNDQRLIEYKNNIEKLENELNFTKVEKDIIKLIDYFTFFQDERKAFSLRANHYTHLFIKEVAKRSGLSYDLVKILSPYEYPELLADKFPLEKIKARQRHMSLLFYRDGLKILEGGDSEKKEKEIFGDNIGNTTNEFEGMRAMGGKVIGKVRVILLVEDLKTMQVGEILVTTMTSPDFIMAMKKASAIVTDEGGLTCHASVISRELGIPCVIGTKIATRVLKTGDMIEVRANHGIIKILKNT